MNHTVHELFSHEEGEISTKKICIHSLNIVSIISLRLDYLYNLFRTEELAIMLGKTLDEIFDTFHDEDVTMDPALVAAAGAVVVPVVVLPAPGGLLLLLFWGLLPLPLLSAYNKRQSCWVWT